MNIVTTKIFSEEQFSAYSRLRIYFDDVKNADTKHREIVLDNTLVCDALYESVQARDLPGYVDVDSSLLLFCKEIKQNYTVALSGECADELFGGYPWYHNHEILFDDCFPWSKVRIFAGVFSRTVC